MTETDDYPKMPRKGVRPPFGYRANKNDMAYWEPVPLELEALALAREHLKTCSYREVARWLSEVTGRSISSPGLFQLIDRERKRRISEASTRRNTARQEAGRLAREEESNAGSQAEAEGDAG